MKNAKRVNMKNKNEEQVTANDMINKLGLDKRNSFLHIVIARFIQFAVSITAAVLIFIISNFMGDSEGGANFTAGCMFIYCVTKINLRYAHHFK